MMYLLSYSFFIYPVYFGVVTSHKYYFHTSAQRFFSKMKLVKTSLRTQLKQTNLENRLHILTESPKECFNDMVFHHFMDELKQCNSDMRMDLRLSVFLCLHTKC